MVLGSSTRFGRGSRKYPLLAVLAVPLIFGVATARATLFLTLINGTNSVTVNDGGTGDSNPVAGQVAYFGPIGNFAATITVATSNSPGTAADSLLQISSIDVANVGTGQQTLQVIIGDTGFANPSGSNLTLQGSYAGTLTNAQTGDFTNFQSFADTSDSSGGKVGSTVTSTALQSFTVTTPVSLTAFSSNISAPFAASAPYSLTNVTFITLSPNAQANVSGTTVVTPSSGNGVPEPASLLLLAPVGLALLSRRRRVRLPCAWVMMRTRVFA